MPKVHIFTGHYGSGKTEVSINYAFYLKNILLQERVSIVDLDVVNPYFRTADAKEKLEEKGIRVFLPLYANSNVDVPALTPEIGGAIADHSSNLVLDVGGDDLGAKVLGRYADDLSKRGYFLNFVINTNRPYTDTLEKAIRMYDEIEEASTLKITGIVNNTNLFAHTTPETMEAGMDIIARLAEIKKAPVIMWSAMENIAHQLKGKVGDAMIFPMKEYVKLLFERE